MYYLRLAVPVKQLVGGKNRKIRKGNQRHECELNEGGKCFGYGSERLLMNFSYFYKGRGFEKNFFNLF